MTRIIARNSAPMRRNSPAAQTKARIRHKTEWTGFLATITPSADPTRIVAKIQKNTAWAPIVSLLAPNPHRRSPSPSRRRGRGARGPAPIALRRGRAWRREPLIRPDAPARKNRRSSRRPIASRLLPQGEKAFTDRARRARCCAPAPAPSDRRSPAAVACRSRVPRAIRSRIRNSVPRRSRRPGRLPGTSRSRCI